MSIPVETPASNVAAFTAMASAVAPLLPGTTTNDDAAAGRIGEYLETLVAVGSSVTLTTNTAATIATLALTAGDWDVWAEMNFAPGATTSTQYFEGSISATAATRNTSVGFLACVGLGSGFVTGVNGWTLTLPPVRVSLAAPASRYLIGYSTFSVSTNAGFGVLKARRVR